MGGESCGSIHVAPGTVHIDQPGRAVARLSKIKGPPRAVVENNRQGKRLVQRPWAVALIASFISVAPASGHHSEAGFDSDAVIAFRGRVTAFNWRNPHVYIHVETIDAAGNTNQWQVETGATPIMTRSGWTPDSLIPGEIITVRGHPERDSGRDYALLLSLEKEDGTVLAQSGGDPQTVARATSLSGAWKGRAETLGPFYQEMAATPLTEKGAAAQADFDFYTDSPSAQCIGYPSPFILATGLYVSEIETDDDIVVIRNEFFDATRTVFMDGRDHPETGVSCGSGHGQSRVELRAGVRALSL